MKLRASLINWLKIPVKSSGSLSAGSAAETSQKTQENCLANSRPSSASTFNREEKMTHRNHYKHASLPHTPFLVRCTHGPTFLFWTQVCQHYGRLIFLLLLLFFAVSTICSKLTTYAPVSVLTLFCFVFMGVISPIGLSPTNLSQMS